LSLITQEKLHQLIEFVSFKDSIESLCVLVMQILCLLLVVSALAAVPGFLSGQWLISHKLRK
jgi:hypothetical protein